MPVHTVTRGYSWRDFEVTFDFEVDADAPSKLEPKESLPAIEPLPEVMSAETLAAAIAPTPTAPVEIPNA